MEVFMRSVSRNVDDAQVRLYFANSILHTDHFKHLHPTRMNFHVYLHPDKKRLYRHGGTGILTLPDEETANHFLSLFGGLRPPFPVVLDRMPMSFSKGKGKKPRKDVQEKLMLPYMDPWVVANHQRRVEQLTRGQVKVNTIQFGWACRDYVFSVECEQVCEKLALLTFSEERRELQIEMQINQETYIIAMNFSHLQEITVHTYLQQDPVIVLDLNTPPTYKCKTRPLCQRLSFLPIPDHERVAPYASLLIRLVCSSPDDLREFRRLSNVAQLHKILDYEYPIEYRNIFSVDALRILEQYLQKFSWCISFQITALLRDMVVDVQEILQFIPFIVDVSKRRGKTFTAALLRKFASHATTLYWSSEDVDQQTLLKCLRDAEGELARSSTLSPIKPTEGSLYDAYRVSITPTSMSMEGPFPERSNRVIRAYDPRHHESFIRVSFLDESKLQYRFDREMDGPGFIRSRVGPILLQGLVIAGRMFEFLAYSQSALKEHAVLFVKPFRTTDGTLVNAKSIIKSLGTFDRLQFDTKLIYCPARYAARLSQAFTATDAVEVEVEEILPINDITTNDGKYQFTDGVGTMSKELSVEIFAQLQKSRRSGRLPKSRSAPAAYQIRFMGSKGMISVDYKLKGLSICTRPSMTKFEASDWSSIEIARAFDRPGPYFLNRPLIMLLEGLGVPYEVFERYQDIAVAETKKARGSLGSAASGLFDRYGLGSAYRLSSVLHHLEKLGVRDILNSSFYDKMLEYSINHVLRDFKNYARIPVPGAWTLVGVADVHRYLRPGEIFACIKPTTGRTLYLEGPVLVSRSPTIHPGDAMIVHAIGRPPPGSCFSAEPLPNTVVFSVQGDRPIPSCLGGGDLDGDVYNLIPLNDLPEFRPRISYPPASYDPAPKKMLDRPSTMADVAEFVMEYINSDVVGIIAMNWLLIADQSAKNIFDEKCMKLASLHSNAVDYPKSGHPVAIGEIPKPELRVKPDWHAPETMNTSSGQFYESTRAIGRLFRAIDLPIEERTPETRSRHRHRATNQRRQTTVNGLAEQLDRTSLRNRGDNLVFSVIKEHVGQYIDAETPRPTEEEFVSRLFDDYASGLQAICLKATLSRARAAQLSEEEAIVGTIMQKTSQRRLRKDKMAELRQDTDQLVCGIREALTGDEDISDEQYLARSWVALKLSSEKAYSKEYGAQSFAWVALGAIFDAIREIDESMK